MPAKMPEIPPEMEDKLERMYGVASPDPAFARRLREQIVEQAANIRVKDWRAGIWLHSAWRWGLGLAGMALLVAFLVFSISLLPKSSLAPAGGPTAAALLPTASPTPEVSPQSVYTAVPTSQTPQGAPITETISGTQSLPSPDGKWKALFDHQAGSLEVVGTQGESYPLFPAGSTVSEAMWSPDSLRLAVVLSNWPEKASQSGVRGIPEIWIVSFAEGTPGKPGLLYQPESTESQIGAQAGQISLGSWSPDSRRLAFWFGPQSASLQADGLPLWVLDADSGQASLLSQATLLNPAYQSWAPDGSALAFTDGGYRSALIRKHLSLYDVSSGEVSTLVPEEKQVPGALTWSPGGDWIAYAAVEADQTGLNWADLMNWDNPALLARRIYLLNPQNGETRRLNQAEAYQDAPRWSPDGARLYYVQMDGDGVNLMSADLADGTAQALTGCSMPLPDPAGYYGQVDWEPFYESCPQVMGGGTSSPSLDSSPEPAIPTDTPQASMPSKIIFDAGTRFGVEIFSVGPGSQPVQLTHDSDESASLINTGPACSPDGRWIAFVGIRDGQRDIYLMRPDGSGETRLTDDPADDVAPAFSPDGEQIAFVSQRDGNNGIYIMNLDGTILGSLANLPGSAYSPAWSPDGSQIAFTSYQDGHWQIYLVNLDGSGVVNISNYPGSDHEPAWSPDGSKIAFFSSQRSEGNQEVLYVINKDGSGLAPLTPEKSDHMERDMGPAWSPDGKWIAFYSYREGYSSGIFETPADGSGQKGLQIALTPNTLKATNPCWLPVNYEDTGQQGGGDSTERPTGTLIPFADDPTGLVNIRLGPSANYELAGTLPGGTQVVPLGRTEAGDWIQIEYPQGSGQTAWVYYTLIELRNGALPVVEQSTPSTP